MTLSKRASLVSKDSEVRMQKRDSQTSKKSAIPKQKRNSQSSKTSIIPKRSKTPTIAEAVPFLRRLNRSRSRQCDERYNEPIASIPHSKIPPPPPAPISKIPQLRRVNTRLNRVVPPRLDKKLPAPPPAQTPISVVDYEIQSVEDERATNLKSPTAASNAKVADILGLREIVRPGEVKKEKSCTETGATIAGVHLRRNRIIDDVAQRVNVDAEQELRSLKANGDTPVNEGAELVNADKRQPSKVWKEQASSHQSSHSGHRRSGTISDWKSPEQSSSEPLEYEGHGLKKSSLEIQVPMNSQGGSFSSQPYLQTQSFGSASTISGVGIGRPRPPRRLQPTQPLQRRPPVTAGGSPQSRSPAPTGTSEILGAHVQKTQCYMSASGYAGTTSLNPDKKARLRSPGLSSRALFTPTLSHLAHVANANSTSTGASEYERTHKHLPLHHAAAEILPTKSVTSSCPVVALAKKLPPVRSAILEHRSKSMESLPTVERFKSTASPALPTDAHKASRTYLQVPSSRRRSCSPSKLPGSLGSLALPTTAVTPAIDIVLVPEESVQGRLQKLEDAMRDAILVTTDGHAQIKKGFNAMKAAMEDTLALLYEREGMKRRSRDDVVV